MARSKSQPIKIEAETEETPPAVTETDIVSTDEEIAGAPDGGGAIEETIESLRAQRDAANARAEREANARQAAERQVGSAMHEAADSNLLAMSNALESFGEAKKALMAKIKEAKETGNYDDEIAATDQLQQINGRIQRVTEGKNELERRIEEAKEAREHPADPIEQYIAGANLNGRAASFIRQHGDLIATNGAIDGQKLNDLNYAHAKAVRDGHAPGTDGYFTAIEDELIGGASDGGPSFTAEAAPARQRPPAAPPSRRSDPSLQPARRANLPGGVEMLSDGRYRLSADRRDAARISGMSDTEYLTNLLALHKEGALRPN